MRDKYKDFQALSLAERLHEDFSIELSDRATPIAIAAPHGGGIEPGTSEIARSIARNDFSCYVFAGLKKTGNREALHITSSNFDEPSCVALLSSATIVVTIHGEESEGNMIFLGGLHVEACQVLRTNLTNAGFDVRNHSDPNLQGLHRKNICNIGQAGRGIQLELARGLRSTFFKSLSRSGRTQTTPRLLQFADAVRTALHQIANV